MNVAYLTKCWLQFLFQTRDEARAEAATSGGLLRAASAGVHQEAGQGQDHQAPGDQVVRPGCQGGGQEQSQGGQETGTK